MRLLPWLALLALVWSAAPARAGDLRAEIHLNYNSDRDFTYTVDLPASQSSDIESDPERTLRPHIEEAKKKLAVKQGYSPQIYGDDYYKMIRVDKMFFKVTDTSTSRVIAETRRGSG
jgi:hypothetical protein